MKRRLVSAVAVMESLTMLLGIPLITRNIGEFEVEIWSPLLYAYIFALIVGVWLSKFQLSLLYVSAVHGGMSLLMFLVVPVIAFLVTIFYCLWVAAELIGMKIDGQNVSSK